VYTLAKDESRGKEVINGERERGIEISNPKR
jgi:hypothetical protein